MIFANPPLVEILAELRWVPGQVSPPMPVTTGPGTIQLPLLSQYIEQTFSNFLNQVAQRGFGMSERLTPPGFPYIPFNVVYRFRKPPPQPGNFLYQIGPGIFTAHALPPYRDWQSFRPIVQEGTQALLASRHDSESAAFTSAKLQYIDLFSEEFTEGRSSFRFLNDILGIKLELPDTISTQALDMGRVQAGLQLSLPLSSGLAMKLRVYDGGAAGKQGIVMTTEVFTLQPTPPEVNRIMQTFDNAHTSIRTTFVGLTERIRAKMRPVTVQ